MRDIGHFIGGKEVKGTSGRTGDVFNPNTGEVQAKVAFASKSEVEKAIANAAGGPAGLGRDQSAAPRPRDVQVPGAGRRPSTTISPGCSPPSTARPSPTPRATSSAASRWSSSPAAFRT